MKLLDEIKKRNLHISNVKDIDQFVKSAKETQETKFWLRILSTAEPNAKEEARELWKEAKNLL